MAAPYLISYDLRKVRNYNQLLNTLRDWGCISPLESVWVGHMNGAATTIRDLLAQHMDADDGLLVVQIQSPGQWATMQVKNNAADWFRKHVAA
ncbi:hypothetical protein [Rhizobium sp. BK379]|jgi:hypothetical protein|uniref:CRISPR-associated endonuclease Cas2 n=1 Tax=Rhizobium sp. BK379 TaxID=2587059 RepID=UPI00036DD6D4|nr:hypothetical protein [Rhizobium sp. BK379]MBB3447211.1 hypothetical protein [Rhizobium sp. BK379]